ncbi:serine carboxypeptidase-like 17 isoform X1 [Ziziphus jujuba]|uniref:Serine carboxypeptidase-like 17 isoform X1 n=1 Tax=Ziziphus jujuba TaxID=326968 RepID=A0ABM3IVZ2_ZIZJJ|nr:serine carboxypeptidase-like 17 isoform X1 [Ziziphus jujuba]
MSLCSSIHDCKSYIFMRTLLVLLLFGSTALCGSIIKTLPGFPGILPFKLETGYIKVESSEFFYYFVESQGNPSRDPLILHQLGGPGCSGLIGFLKQIGPLVFNLSTYGAILPSLQLAPYSWTEISSVIFIDAPIGTGFSYSNNPEDYFLSSDTNTAWMVNKFIRKHFNDESKWLEDHSEFKENPFIIGGDSYGGLLAPIYVQEILEGNKMGQEPFINLKGFYVGSGHTDTDIEKNSIIPYVYHMGLISDDQYERVKESCGGNYVHVNATNTNCLNDIAKIAQCTKHINIHHILRTYCKKYLVKSKKDNQIQARRSTEEMSFCDENIPAIAIQNWANNKIVQDALQVRKGTFKKWYRCNFEDVGEGTYTNNVKSAVGYHKNLTNSSIEVLVYIGDHEIAIPHISAERWIKSLNLTLHSDWRPWYTADQVAGYTMTYKNFNYRLTYATVKGAGHSPTEYKRKECYAMIQRWMNKSPL